MPTSALSPLQAMKSRAPHPIPDGEAISVVAPKVELPRRQEPNSIVVVGQCGSANQSGAATAAIEPHSTVAMAIDGLANQIRNAGAAVEPYSGADVAKPGLTSKSVLPAAPEPHSVVLAKIGMTSKRVVQDPDEPIVTVAEAMRPLPPHIPMPSAHGHTIGVIRELHRQRNDLLKTEGDLTRRIRAICRRTVEYDPFAPAKEKAAKMAQANEMYKQIQGLGGHKEHDTLGCGAADDPDHFESEEGQPPADSHTAHFDPALTPSGEDGCHKTDDTQVIVAIPFAAPCIAESERTIRKQRMVVERMMTNHAKSMPIFASFVEPLPGFGALGFAQIIGEAGDLGLYANPAKLWKRMGLGLVDGERQRKHTDKAKAEAAGYNPRRRSTMYVIGDSMIKKQGPMRDVYLARKLVEVQKAEAEGLTVLPAAKIKAKDAENHRSEGHIHKRAQRYMEKRLLRDLWRAWRDQPA